MKSHKLHKFLMLMLLMMMTIIAASAWSQPLDIKPEALPTTTKLHQNQPILLLQNNVNARDMKDYEIIIPKAPRQDEPCLTITWKTNPDGSGPDDPKIYLVNGYFKIMPSTTKQRQ